MEEDGRNDLEAERIAGPDIFIKRRGRTNRSSRGGRARPWPGREINAVRAGCFLLSKSVGEPEDPGWEAARWARESRRSCPI